MARWLSYFYLRHIRNITTPKKLIGFAARCHRKRIFLVDGEKEISFGQINDDACRLANALLNRGIGKGIVVASLMSNSREMVTLRLAAYKAGWLFSALIDDFGNEVALEVLKDIEAKVLFVDGRNLHRVNFQRLRKYTDVMLVVTTREADGDSMLFDAVLAEGSPVEPAIDVKPMDLAAIGFTSGTTGRSKGIVWSNRAWISSFYNLLLNSRRRVLGGDVFLHVVPLSTAGSLTLLPCFAAGVRNIFMAEYDPAAICDTVRKHKVTRLLLAPAFLVDLWDYCEAEGRLADLGTLKNINVGSAPLHGGKHDLITRALGPIVEYGYGMAEVLAPLTALRDGRLIWDRRLGLTVGHPAARVEIQLEGQEKDGCGIIVISSRSMAHSYWKRPELTKEHFHEDWFLTNDVGCFDADGRLYVLDRVDNIIERGEHIVYPRIIEETIQESPSVKDAAVVERDGQIVAFVTPRRGQNVDMHKLAAHCSAHLPRREQPDEITMLDHFPISSSGKILKRKLVRG